MSALCDFAETTLINAALRNVSFTPPTTWFVALHTADPTETGAVAEVGAVGGYARKAVTFIAPTDGVTSNTGIVTWTASGAAFGTITHVSIRDASSGGNAWFKGALTLSKIVNDGDTIEFAVAALVASLA